MQVKFLNHYPFIIASVSHIDLRLAKRNPIEGKFRQVKIRYGLDCIQAKLKNTSESWMAPIFLVLNLVKLVVSIPPSSAILDRKLVGFFNQVNDQNDYVYNYIASIKLFSKP